MYKYVVHVLIKLFISTSENTNIRMLSKNIALTVAGRKICNLMIISAIY